MRKTGTSRWITLNALGPARRSRAVRIGMAALGVGLMLGGGLAHAQDSDDDDSTFEEKVIKNIMGGLGAVNGTESGIEYRERSPLVIPPKIDLPPPQTAAATPANWPKDVDAAERKRLRAAEKNRVMGNQGARPLTPAELAVGTTKRVAATEPLQPGVAPNPMLSPSQLGFKGSLWNTMFGGSKTESAPFTGEPDRETLTQPPPGYQTPSPDFVYGTGPKQPLAQQGVYNIQTGKEIK